MPSTPVNRPMNAPDLRSHAPNATQNRTHRKISGAEDATNQRTRSMRSLRADEEVGSDEIASFLQPVGGIVVDCREGVSCFYAVADALVEFQADGVIDRVFLFLAAAAKDGERDPELLGVRAGDEACGWTGDVNAGTRLRQK